MKKISKKTKILIITLIFTTCLITISSASAVENNTDLGNLISTATPNSEIQLGEGTYKNNATNIAIQKNITIIGKGADKTIIDAQKQGRIFNIINNGILTLTNITITNGNGDYGGSISNSEGTLIIINCKFSNNSAYYGGAIHNQEGIITIFDSNFINNSAYYGGAILNERKMSFNGTDFIYTFANLTIKSTIFQDNAAMYGGAICSNYGNIDVSYSIFLNNIATVFSDSINNIFVTNANVSIDCNWWGSNNPGNIQGTVTLNNYYVMHINASGSNWTVGDYLPVNYYFVLNGTQNNTGADLLPYFNTVFYYNGNEINVTDARTSQTVLIPLTTAKLDSNITAITDNEQDTILFNVSKGETILIVVDGSTETNNAIDLTAKITDKKNGASLSGKTVKFYVNGVYVGNATTNINGIATYTYTPISPGNYTINASFEEDDDYLNSSKISNLEVSKGETSLIVDDVTTEFLIPVNLTAKLTNNGNPLNGKTVKFYVNGVYVGNATTNINGIATYTYTPISPGNYTINASFEEDDDYLNSSKISNLEVSKGETSLIVDDVTTEFLIPVNLTAKLTNNGNPLNGKVVKFYVNGEYIGDAVTGLDGVAIFSYTPTEAGNYTVNATFEEDIDYLNSSFERLLIVTIPEPTPEPPEPTPTPTPSPTPTPTPEPEDSVNPDTPEPEDDEIKTVNNKTSNNPTASAVMKETGIPINLLLIVLLSVLSVLIGRKQN